MFGNPVFPSTHDHLMGNEVRCIERQVALSTSLKYVSQVRKSENFQEAICTIYAINSRETGQGENRFRDVTSRGGTFTKQPSTASLHLILSLSHG